MFLSNYRTLAAVVAVWMPASLCLGAACCGGNATMPSILAGDDRSQLTVSAAAGVVDGEAQPDGSVAARSDNDYESSYLMRLDAATLIADRWQVGTTIPVIRRYRSRNGSPASAAGLGDISLNLGYEFLPEWTYSSWRPKGIAFVQGSLPTGGSVYDASELYFLDSRGRGFFSLGAGTLFVKRFGSFDSLLLGEIHHSIPRTVQRSAGDARLTPGWGMSMVVGIGWSPGSGRLRLGVSATHAAEGQTVLSGAIQTISPATRSWISAVQASWLWDDDLTVTVVGSDNHLLGGARSTAMTRALTFLLQKRWPR